MSSILQRRDANFLIGQKVDRPKRAVWLAGSVILLLCLLTMSLAFNDSLPSPTALAPGIANEPIQLPTSKQPFDVTVANMTYHVVPLASYDLTGLVVSYHDSKVWWDYIHKEVGDFLNVNDLCVVWGADAVTGLYQEMSFSNCEFCCEVHLNTMHAVETFQEDGLSNNHMLTDDPAMARALRKLRIGDQIRFKGYLVNYANLTTNPTGYRNTSLTRDDAGCELVLITDLEVLHRHTRIWAALIWISLLGLAACLVVYVQMPYRSSD